MLKQFVVYSLFIHKLSRLFYTELAVGEGNFKRV